MVKRNLNCQIKDYIFFKGNNEKKIVNKVGALQHTLSSRLKKKCFNFGTSQCTSKDLYSKRDILTENLREFS